MGATTKTNVLLIAPELTAVSDDAWTLVLSDVAAQVSSAVYGIDQERAQRYLAAHYLTLISLSSSIGSQVSGPLVSETVGQVSKTYAQGSYADKSRYDETSYGRTFSQIRKSCVIGFTVYAP